MKNKDLFSYKRILDMLTGEYVDEIMPTDMQIAGNSETPSSSGNFALVTFDILPGQECIIGDVDFGAGASATAEIQASYVDILGTSKTITRYVYLGAAGFINEQHDVNRNPFMAFYNPTVQGTNTPANTTVTMTVISASDTVEYTGNIAYVARSSE